MSNRKAEISISIELLRDILGMPDSVDILASSVDHGTGVVRLIVAHPALDEVPEGHLPPRATVPMAELNPMDRPRWARARMVTGAINVNGADVVLLETLVVRKG